MTWALNYENVLIRHVCGQKLCWFGDRDVFSLRMNHGALITTLKTLFWNIWIFLICVAKQLPQIRHAWVIIGSYLLIKLFVHKNWTFFINDWFLYNTGNSIDSRRYASCNFVDKCGPQGNLLSRVTSRYFTVGFKDIGTLSNFNGNGVEWQRRLKINCCDFGRVDINLISYLS